MKRRGQGEGSITQRVDGRWMARLEDGVKDGKRQRRYIYGKTRKEVSESLRRALHEQQQGTLLPMDRQTVGQFLEHWLADVVEGAVRTRTHKSYAQVVRLYLAPLLGKQQLTKLTPQEVQAMMKALRERGLSARTVAYTRAVLRRGLGQALKWGLVARNVATLVEPPKTESHQAKFLTATAARRLLDATADDRLGTLYAVAVAMGLRQGEILGLRWNDVDFDAGTITIRRQLQRLDG